MVLANMVFLPIWGEKMRRSEHAHASYPGLFFSSARVQPLYGAGRKESSGTGLTQNRCRSVHVRGVTAGQKTVENLDGSSRAVGCGPGGWVLPYMGYIGIQFKVDRLQMIVVAKNLSVLQLFISRMPKMCAILQLVSAPLFK